MTMGFSTIAAENESSQLPRHPLEREALIDPQGVLLKIDRELRSAAQATDPAQLSLLQLARANACRVVADWQCQREAGELAAEAGNAAADIVLEVRGLIAEARGALSVDDMVYGERVLGRAEVLLESAPNGELTADIELAYSSLSYRLGRHQMARLYAERGLKALDAGVARPMRVRLLRNRSRAVLELGEFDEAEQSLLEALELAVIDDDPKLLAEIHLELARSARRQGDAAGQIRHGNQILAIAKRLQNSQLTGLGHEVLGYAALDQGLEDLAKVELNTAQGEFAALDLSNDELRLMPPLLQLAADPEEIVEVARRLLELDRRVDVKNRRQATADFDLRLKYAQQELDLSKLQLTAELTAARLEALQDRNRLITINLVLLGLVAVMAIWRLISMRGANKQLKAALESKYRALMTTSHELRNPIAGVVGLAELLLRSPLRDSQRDMVRALMGASESIGKLAQDLLDRGRAETGRLRLTRHRVCLRELVQETEQLFGSQARGKGVIFKIELDDRVPREVITDGGRIRQILTNLLSNALKFTSSGEIALRVAVLGPADGGKIHLQFEVADSGPGLTAEDKLRLFEPFAKGSRGERQTMGAGLGLSICKDLVTLLGGTIRAESEAGQGTTMRFDLTLEVAEAKSSTDVPESSIDNIKPHARSLRAMVVDDDPDLAMLLSAQAEALGCAVDCATSVEACRELAKQHTYELIMLDQELDGGELGSALASELSRSCRGRPRIVVVSGNQMPDLLPDGVDEWVVKPMRMDHLGRIVDAIERSRGAA